MKKEIVIVAAVYHSGGWEKQTLANNSSYVVDESPWHSEAANQCLAVVGALKNASDKFLVKVLTGAPADSPFARALKLINPDILLSGYAIEKVDVLTRALDGAYGVFLVTDVRYDLEEAVSNEVTLGRSVANACARADIKHLVYCTRMHVYASIGLRSDPCDAKAHVSDYLSELSVPKTLLVVPFFYEDFFFGLLKPFATERKDVYKIIAASGRIPIDTIGQEDFGNCVRSIFENSQQWIGKTIALSGDKMPIKDYAQILTNESRNNYSYLDAQITPEDFLERFHWDGVEDMANYFDYLTRCVQRNNQIATSSLYDCVLNFYDWVKINQSELRKLGSN